MLRLTTLAVVLSFLVGCGGSQSDDAARDTSQSKATTSVAQTGNSKGIGPVTEIELGPVNDSVAAHGKGVFETKCSACHKWEERYVGPALNGVTQRREPEWIMNMILNPDQMIKEDEQAKALFAEYLTPMTYQNVTAEDAEAILTYFRSLDSGATK
jgi:mono/diheme cytochrome c family protein